MNKPRRVLLLDHTAALGGGEIALLNLVGALDRARYEPWVVLFSDGPLAGKLREIGVMVEVVELDKEVGGARKDSLGAGSLLKIGKAAKSVAFIRRLAKKIREVKPVVVHCNSLKADLLGGLAGRLARKKVLWHVRDRITADYLPARVAGFFRRAARRVPHMVLANSAATMETLALPLTFVEKGRGRVVHDGIPDPYSGQREVVGGQTGEELRVGIVGRISPWKGQHVFLEAAAEVVAKFAGRFAGGAGVRFLVIGGALFAEEEYEKSLRELVAKKGLGQLVEFLGFRKPEEIPELIRGLDILVHASTIGEPFGQVIIEGMIAGKAVIATRGGGVPEIATDRENALLVPMGDVGAMAAAMAELLEDAGLRKRLGEAGRRHVLGHFMIGQTAEKVMAAYDALVG